MRSWRCSCWPRKLCRIAPAISSQAALRVLFGGERERRKNKYALTISRTILDSHIADVRPERAHTRRGWLCLSHPRNCPRSDSATAVFRSENCVVAELAAGDFCPSADVARQHFAISPPVSAAINEWPRG